MAIDGVKSCTVNLVFDPPWDPSLMSDEAKLATEHVLTPYRTMEPHVQPRARRPRPKVVTLTERAAERVREIMARPRSPTRACASA